MAKVGRSPANFVPDDDEIVVPIIVEKNFMEEFHEKHEADFREARTKLTFWMQQEQYAQDYGLENTGVITGIGTTIFSGKLGIKFNIKSYHNDPFDLISVGNPIYVFDTRSGDGIISIDKTGTDSNVIGIGTSFSDNIYEIVSVTTDAGTKSGIITAHIKSDTVVTNIDLSGSEAQPVGKYSVGSITNLVRGSNPISIGVTGFTVGLTTAVGISTFPILKRTGGDKTFEQTGALIPE